MDYLHSISLPVGICEGTLSYLLSCVAACVFKRSRMLFSSWLSDYYLHGIILSGNESRVTKPQPWMPLVFCTLFWPQTSGSVVLQTAPSNRKVFELCDTQSF